MTPEDPNKMSSSVDAMAARAMGVPPQGQMPVPQGQQMAPAKAPEKDSAQDKAAAEGSPKTEDDKSSENPVVYDIAFGEKTRQMTPQQISSTFERYAALNHKQAQYRPIIDLIEQTMQRNPGMSPSQIAESMKEFTKAQEKNPTMGNTEGDKSGDNKKTEAPQDMDTMLSQWENDNAASLPPGYKDMIQGGQSMKQMQEQMMGMQRMMQAVLAQSQGVADAAKTGMGKAQNGQTQAIQGQIANNIDRVQQALKIPDDKAQDFVMFAAERGYTMEDFVDPRLTIKVMQDFRNSMDSPEMDRMRQIAQRRQAFTGSMGQTPAGGAGAPPAADAQNASFDQFAGSIMAKKGMGA